MAKVTLKKIKSNNVNFLGPWFELVPENTSYERIDYYSKLVLINDKTKEYVSFPAARDEFGYFMHLLVDGAPYQLKSTGIYPDKTELYVDGNFYLIKFDPEVPKDGIRTIIEGNAVREYWDHGTKARLVGLFSEDICFDFDDEYEEFEEAVEIFGKDPESYFDYVGLENSYGQAMELEPKYRKNVRTVVLNNGLTRNTFVPDMLIRDGNKICSRYLVFDRKYEERLTNPVFVKTLETQGCFLGCFLGPKFILGERKEEVDGESCRIVVENSRTAINGNGKKVGNKLYIRMTDPMNFKISGEYIEVIDTGIEADNLEIKDEEGLGETK